VHDLFPRRAQHSNRSSRRNSDEEINVKDLRAESVHNDVSVGEMTGLSVALPSARSDDEDDSATQTLSSNDRSAEIDSAAKESAREKAKEKRMSGTKPVRA